MSKDKERHDGPDDFAGISRGGAAFLMTVVALAHPWQTLKELRPMVRGLGRQALKLPLVPFALVAAILWSRRKDRGLTFEDYLHGFGEENDHP
ncbi:hypothetical protein GCM10023195_64470 [Actinoallomurus liliacearum]|uniref:Uncharacterized protein n=1 Tax=Actinoallomurus liliacearum TaxID=1080073 RepID=A0ABP8TU54_9ACTN